MVVVEIFPAKNNLIKVANSIFRAITYHRIKYREFVNFAYFVGQIIANLAKTREN